MEAEKRLLFATILSTLFIIAYSSLVMKPSRSPATVRVAPTTKPATISADTTSYRLIDEPIASIESNVLRVEIGRATGAIRSVTLKTFDDVAGKSKLKILPTVPILQVFGQGQLSQFRVEEAGARRFVVEGVDRQSKPYRVLPPARSSHQEIAYRRSLRNAPIAFKEISR